MNITRSVRHAMGGLLRRLSVWGMLKVAHQETSGDFTLIDLTRDQVGRPFFPVLARALTLIDQHEPRRTRRMARDVKRIAVMNAPTSAGEYWPHYDALAIDVRHLATHTLESVCLTIVHEATHARINRWVGDSVDHERIEKACVRQEIVFAMKVSGTERLIEGAKLKLETEWWKEYGDSSKYKAQLELLRSPNALKQFLVWLNR